MATVSFNFGSRRIKFGVPDDWRVQKAIIKGAPTLSQEEFKASFRRPIRSKAVSEIAKGKDTAVILVDDLSRPTPADKLLPIVIDELKRGGISENGIRVIVATGAHRALTGVELEKKLGKGVLETVEVSNHNPYENLIYLGVSSKGTPIYVNRFVKEADLKVGLGCVIPHALSGFSGGGKIILPGVCGMETIDYNHHMLKGGFGKLDKNPNRADIDEVAGKVGLDAMVNVVVNAKGETAGVFVGDLIHTHREAVEFAKETYATSAIYGADMAILNAYPFDFDFFVALKALWNGFGLLSTKEAGVILMTAACEQRLGYHALYHRGARREKDLMDAIVRKIKGRKLFIFSPNLSQRELFQVLHKDTDIRFYDDMDTAIKETNLPRNAKVIVFPTAPLSLLSQKREHKKSFGITEA